MKSRPEILIGVPSYNEENSISYVVDQIAGGLKRYFRNKTALILNLDGGSTDETRAMFMRTRTRIPKKSLVVRGMSGKGSAFRILFQNALRLNPKVIIVVDADLKSITPEWIKYLATPIFKGYDYVTPFYSRNQYDGTITNNITYPLIYGLLGCDMRQPMGGEFAFNTKLSRYWLSRKWSRPVRLYGIDSFMSFTALLNGFKVGQVGLGAKIHNPSVPKLGPMFSQVVETIFTTLVQSRNKWLAPLKRVRKIPTFGRHRIHRPPHMEVNYRLMRKTAKYEYRLSQDVLKRFLSEPVFEEIRRRFRSTGLHISSRLWCKAIYDLIYAYDLGGAGQAAIDALRPLYFARTASFIERTYEFSDRVSEKEIIKQAREFFRHRNYLLDKYKKTDIINKT